MIELEAVKAALQEQATDNNRDLIQRFCESGQIEFQYGREKRDERDTYISSPHLIHYPDDASDAPKWDAHFEPSFPLLAEPDFVGSTWFTRDGSMAATYDFDGPGHKGNSQTAQQIEAIRQAASEIPFCEVRYSRSGNGLHIYIWLDGFTTANRREHRQVSDCIWEHFLKHELQSRLDFEIRLDVAGQVMWLSAPKPAERGFELLSAATEVFTPEHLGIDWKTYVAERVRSFNYPDIELDADHQRLLDRLMESGAPLDVINSEACPGAVYTRTSHLAAVHQHGGFRGIFETASGDDTSFNCMLFPRANGAWLVVRWGRDKETGPNWWRPKDGEYTLSHFNVRPTIKQVCDAIGASPTKDGFGCDSQVMVSKAASLLGVDIPLFPPEREFETVTFKVKGDVVLVETRKQGVKDQPKGWGQKDGRTLQLALESPTIYEGANQEIGLDVRQIVVLDTEGIRPKVYQYRDGHRRWVNATKADIITRIMGITYGNRKNAEIYVGSEVMANPWDVVPTPFYVPAKGAREIATGDQLAVSVTRSAEIDFAGIDHSRHPHYSSVFRHAGENLTRYLERSETHRSMGIATGEQFFWYLIAKKLQEPGHPTPIIAAYSPHHGRAGKSTLVKACGLLTKRGIIDAHRALNSQFNGELEGALWYLHNEKKITEQAYYSMKDGCDGGFMSIRRMRTDAYKAPSFGTFFVFTNDLRFFIVEEFDQRFVLWRMNDCQQIIPWYGELMPALLKERGAMIESLLALRLPKSQHQLFPPPLDTPWKDYVIRDCEDYPLFDHIVEWASTDLWRGTISELHAELGLKGCINLPDLRPALCALICPLCDAGVYVWETRSEGTDYVNISTADACAIRVKKKEVAA